MADHKAPDDADEPLEVSLHKLKGRLQGVLGPAAVKGSVRLNCDGHLKHRYVMQVYDVCKQAGFQSVSFVAPAPGRDR